MLEFQYYIANRVAEAVANGDSIKRTVAHLQETAAAHNISRNEYARELIKAQQELLNGYNLEHAIYAAKCLAKLYV